MESFRNCRPQSTSSYYPVLPILVLGMKVGSAPVSTINGSLLRRCILTITGLSAYSL